MRPSTKLGKHVEEESVSESSRLVDRISSLPDELLAHVLSLLPSTRCAVSTSILSTRWRYLFTLTTSLSFVAPCLSRDPGFDEANQRFKEFVDNVLGLHRISSIDKLSLFCEGINDEYYLNRWFRAAVQKGVQELHYKPAGDKFGSCVPKCLPDHFFICETLVKLKMIGRHNSIIHTPRSVWLPKLKIIDLSHITFFDFDSMNRLFSGCQVLEELTLRHCDDDIDYYGGSHDNVVYRSDTIRVLTIEDCELFHGTFEIDTPNLAYLTYNTYIGVKFTPSWKYSASFVEAKLIFNCIIIDSADTNKTFEHERELLKAAANKVTELYFKIDSVQVLLMVGENEEMSDFNNLTKLELGHFPCETWKYVTRLIEKSPRLETLIFETGYRFCSCSCHDYCGEDVVCYCDSLSPSDIPLDPFSCGQVQTIEVRRFCRQMGSLAFARHLLSNASALKKLILYHRRDDDLDLEGEVLMFPRASKDCCLEIKRPRR